MRWYYYVDPPSQTKAFPPLMTISPQTSHSLILDAPVAFPWAAWPFGVSDR